MVQVLHVGTGQRVRLRLTRAKGAGERDAASSAGPPALLVLLPRTVPVRC